MSWRNYQNKSYADLTSAEVNTKLDSGTLIWPTGTIEQHGPHLPLSVDVDIPCALAEATCEMVDNAYTLPPLVYGARSLPQSGGGLSFPGTIYAHGSNLTDYVENILDSVFKLPIKKLVIFNGHYENEAFMMEAIDSCYQRGIAKDVELIVTSWWSLVDEKWIQENLPNFPGWHAEHAGVTETSLMMHLQPDLVRSMRPKENNIPKAGVLKLPIDPSIAASGGVLSSTEGATAEIGASLFDHVVDQLISEIKGPENNKDLEYSNKTTPPTICIANAVDTLRNIARKADSESEYETIVDRSFYQQDQAWLWGGDRKLVITSKPIVDSEWLASTLDMPHTVNLTPRNETDNIFADILKDEMLIQKIVDYCGDEKVGRIIPHTTVDALFVFQREMERRYGIRLELPESPPDLSLRDEFDSKSGFRERIGKLESSFTGVRLPEGVSCENVPESLIAARNFLTEGRACIAKADFGEASIGLNIFLDEESLASLEKELSSNVFLRDEPIVVEEYIHGEGVFFPSIEYEISADKSIPPRMTHICDMLFEGATNLVGNVTSSDFNDQEWSRNFEEAGDIIARHLQEKGYIGHFGMDCVAKRDGDVYLLEMNARRTGSTHLDDFGKQFFGPDYGHTMTIGHYDFFMDDDSFTLDEVLETLGDLVQSPVEKDTGVIPFEMSGFASGRLSFIVFAKSFEEFLDTVEDVRHKINAPAAPPYQPPPLSQRKLNL